jgi:hypothetical protein
MLNTRKIGLAYLLLSALALQIAAQKVHPTAASFGGECSGTKHKFSIALSSLIKKHRSGDNYQDCQAGNEWCGNSFSFDLNSDQRLEYFVRLGCGATGNCTYGIFTDRPAKLIGKVNAWFFWIDRTGDPWRKITTYLREGGDQGYFVTYSNKRRGYRSIGGRTERIESTQKSFFEKMGMPGCPRD